MIAAWAAGLTDTEILALLNAIPHLGAVLYPHQHHLANATDRPTIAYCPTPKAAANAARYPVNGMILGRDEPNVRGEGPSGVELTASESRRQYELALANVRNHPAWKVPSSLVPRQSWWRPLLFMSLFDDEYQRARGVPQVAWSASRARPREIQRVRREYAGPQYVGPALFRSWPGRCLQTSPWWFVRFARENPDTHVAIWSLREVDAPHQPFGLFDRDGQITVVGRAVREALRE